MKRCKSCGSLYIKDFITGTCDNPQSGRGVVQPDDTCKNWHPRENVTASILPDLEIAYKLLNTIDKVYNMHFDGLKGCEAEGNDIHHALELGGLKYAERAKIATRQSRVLQERRKYKDALEVMEPLYNLMQLPEGTAFIRKLSLVLGDARKADKYHKERAYFPRTKTGIAISNKGGG